MPCLFGALDLHSPILATGATYGAHSAKKQLKEFMGFGVEGERGA